MLPGAHLSRNSLVHWGYAVVSAVFFCACLLAMLPSESSSPGWILGVGMITGTIGILVLLGFQFVAAVTDGFWLTRGHWFLLILFYVVKFIGFSYRCAMEEGNGFILSFLGFTCGVGLCEELVKALPVIIYCRESPRVDWRAVCLVGLASGIGFGVSEGITYSGDYYNGVQPLLTYFVRFASCVALHAIWSGTVALLVYSNREVTNAPMSFETVLMWVFNFLLGPMLLHGLYDTLLKQDMPMAALGIAVVSFAWFAWLVWRRQEEFGYATA